MNIKTYLFDSFLKIHNVYQQLGSQKENTCGPFSLSYILKGLGYTRHDGHEIDEDYLAVLAKMLISKKDYMHNKKIKEDIRSGKLTPEEADKKHHTIYYKYEFSCSEKEPELGTSCEGMVNACRIATEGKLMAIPVPSVKDGITCFTPEKFQNLTSYIIKNIKNYCFQIILNYRTDKLLNMHSKNYNFFNIFFSGNHTEVIGYDPWESGHFVSTCGIIEVEGNFFYIIRDTYKNKGTNGYHVQPGEILRKALIRDDDREGGMIVIADKSHEQNLINQLSSLGLLTDNWDNGSIYRE